MRPFDITDWFWKVGEDTSIVWSSAMAGFIPTNESAYLDFIEGGNAPTNIDTQESLLAIFAERYPAGSLWTYAAEKRHATEVGGVSVAGIAVATDDRAKIMVLGARIAAEATAGFTADWVAADGSVHALTAADMIGISDAVLAHVNGCFSVYAGVKSQIDAGVITTIAQIDAAFAAI
jgi:hypothetical protein